MKTDYYTFIDTLDRKTYRAAWFETDTINVYTRKSMHAINGELEPTIDIANVAVREEHQRVGVFKSVLEQAERYAQESDQIKIVYIENVLQEGFAGFFERRGYTEIKYSVTSPSCFYKRFM